MTLTYLKYGAFKRDTPGIYCIATTLGCATILNNMYKERNYYTFTEEEYARFILGEEVWKDIPEYDGYQSSTMGRIKSFRRNTPRILKPYDNCRGYDVVDLVNELGWRTTKVHQIIMITFEGYKPDGMKKVINHINRKRKDNRLLNLEVITNRENCNFKHLGSSSKYIGVCWDKSRKKWTVGIKVGDKRHNLGRFKDEDEAGEVYQTALKKVNAQGFL